MRPEDETRADDGTQRDRDSRPAGPVTEGDSLAHPPGSSPSVPPAGEDDQGSTPAVDDVAEDLNVLLADAEAKRDEYLDIARRTQADFENYRKRMAAEVQGAALRGKAQVARDVVLVLDDLERALASAGLDPEGDSEDGLAHGVLLVSRSLREGLKRNGIEAVDPKGEKFDPNQHEALSTVPVEGIEPGTVVEVLQKGYRLNEQLIRPARVVVSE
jgi:molecular chaperone GrpE